MKATPQKQKTDGWTKMNEESINLHENDCKCSRCKRAKAWRKAQNKPIKISKIKI